MTVEIIRFQNINKSFHIYGKDTVDAVNNVSLSVCQGDVFGFIGLNGAGKTTAIKLMLGLCKADSGDLTLFGQSLSKLNMQKIGFASEIAELPSHLTATELLEYLCNLSDVPVVTANIKACLGIVGLTDIAHKRIATFSKGMKQRLSLAAAIVHDPELIILDEPSSGLDPLGRKMIRQLIIDLHKKGKTVFFSTHILSDISDICNKVGLIHKGALLFKGTIDKFCSDKTSMEVAFEKYIYNFEQVEKRSV